MHTARLTVALVTASLALLSLPATTSVADDAASTESTVILTFDANQSNPGAAARAAVSAAGGAGIVRVRPVSSRTVAVTVKNTSAAQASALNTRLERQSAIASADTSVVFHTSGASANDEYFGYQWDLNNASGSKYGVRAQDAWSKSTGSGVVVAVIDTGLTVHSDLTGPSSLVGGNALAGYDFISDPVSADDGDGWDSDPTDLGGESDYHGTHVAGTVAALTNNGIGVAGVAPKAKVQPLRVIGTDGNGEEADLIAAIRYAAGLSVPGVAANPTPAKIINLSLGGDAKACDSAMQATINAVSAAGAVVVVAAGNGNEAGVGIPLSSTMPANCANVVRVTASTKTGKLASYSNFGTKSLPATIAAPGGEGTSDWRNWILSTWHNADDNSEDYGLMVGTSMAAPHVSGILALMKSAAPYLTAGQLKSMLTSTTKKLSFKCPTYKCGPGIANAPAAVAAALKVQLGKPSWTGTPQVGVKLTATVSVNPTSAKLKWQWLRSGKQIKGATSASYTPTAKDRGKKLSVRVTATANGNSKSVTSASAKVKSGVFTKSVAPQVTGTFTVGSVVTAAPGTWSPQSTKTSYQWLRNGKQIKGATRKTYRLTTKDRATTISVKVTVRRSGYTTATAVSAGSPVA